MHFSRESAKSFKNIWTFQKYIRVWLLSSNGTKIRNEEQGSYCFTMRIKCQTNIAVLLLIPYCRPIWGAVFFFAVKIPKAAKK